MTDQGFREIQLSGKQLVFLFIASAVIAVAVFLLGVSVGRGTRVPGTSIEPVAASAEVTPSAELPPTSLSPADTQFDETLQGKTPTPVPPEPATPVDEPVTAPAAASADKPAATPAGKPVATPGVEPAPATAKPAAASAKVATPAGPSQGWMLQIGAFKSRENADAQVRQLIAKGYSAVVVTGGSLFRVRVGPYAQRPDAERASAKLKSEGISSSITR